MEDLRDNSTYSHSHSNRGQASSTPSGDGKYVPNFRPSNSNSPLSNQSKVWRRKWLLPQNPCFYCGKPVHWEPEFPSCMKVSKAWLSSSQSTANVNSIGAVPLLENGEALLDLGETHSLLGDISLFTNLPKINISLSVASSHHFLVDAIGEIKLTTPQGPLFIADMLLCRAIPGLVLSIDQISSQNISITLSKGNFIIQQGNIIVSLRGIFRYQKRPQIIKQYTIINEINFFILSKKIKIQT
ncbi:hypothetical protein O181_072609 [Austropuccinia psidii MF-1]|uniref:Uncharacterized protein n=1 Tax=Austropuccinia psidii MF-1 TaxID=1389203 RepID=A0A9Q3F5I1_9BASI|nr:hypothetical protein [Austropuccinia psidii MF-1]